MGNPDTRFSVNEGTSPTTIQAEPRLLLLVPSIAIIYYLAGRFGLLFAIPPGFASPVWPPSGFALAALIIWGYRAGFGVFLGSFAMNYWMAWNSGLQVEPLKLVLISSGIGVGATAQAVLGTWLVRRFLDPHQLLEQGKAFATFMLLGGPLCCALSPTVGVSTLCIGGVIPLFKFPYSWWTWWVGDAIGVLIFTPITLVWANRRAIMPLSRRLSITISLCITFCLSVALYVYVDRWDRDRVSAEFERSARQYHTAAQVGINNCINVLQSVHDAFRASPLLTRTEFEVFVEGALSRTPGLQAVSWDPFVTSTSRENFEGAQLADRLGEPAIFELDSMGNIAPAEVRDHYMPVAYLASIRAGRRVIGYDVLSEPTRRTAIEKAVESGQPAVVQPVNLVQDSVDPTGFLIYVPVFESSTANKPLAGWDSLDGCVAGVFKLEDFLAAAFEHIEESDVQIQMFDALDKSGRHPLASYPETVDAGAQIRELGLTASLVRELEIAVADRQWRMRLIPTQSFLDAVASWQPWVVLAGGLALSAIFGVLLTVLIGYTSTVERQVGDRTSDLSQRNEQLRTEITLRQRIEGDLRQRNLEVRTFYQGLSHELKTPLTAIKEFVSIVDEEIAGPTSEAQHRFLKVALKGCDTMNRHINDLLDVSRLETGKLTLTMHACRFDELVQKSALDFVTIASENGVTLNCRVGPEPVVANLDAERVLQVINNLIDNAIKYSEPNGEVTIAAGYAHSLNDHVFVSVEDNGCGIPVEHQDKIFDRLFQVPSDIRGQTRGIGLGLYICRDIVKLHGGSITVESRPGEGSKFTVLIPAVKVATRETRRQEVAA